MKTAPNSLLCDSFWEDKFIWIPILAINRVHKTTITITRDLLKMDLYLKRLGTTKPNKVPILVKREFSVTIYHRLKAHPPTINGHTFCEEWHRRGWGTGEKAPVFTQQSPPQLSSHSHQVLGSSHHFPMASGHGGHLPKPNSTVLQEFSKWNRERGSPYSTAGENRIKTGTVELYFSSLWRKAIYYGKMKLIY